MSNTVNRGWLKKQVELGNVEVRCNYHYTDDYAFDNAYDFGRTDWMPARIKSPKFEEIVNCYGNRESICVDHDDLPGYMNMYGNEFTGNCGRAYRDSRDGGIITLRVHSNLVYSMRIKSQNAKSSVKVMEVSSILVGNTIII